MSATNVWDPPSASEIWCHARPQNLLLDAVMMGDVLHQNFWSCSISSDKLSAEFRQWLGTKETNLTDAWLTFHLFHATETLQDDLVIWISAVSKSLNSSPSACFRFLVGSRFYSVKYADNLVILHGEMGPCSFVAASCDHYCLIRLEHRDTEPLNQQLWGYYPVPAEGHDEVSGCCRDSCLLALWSRTSHNCRHFKGALTLKYTMLIRPFSTQAFLNLVSGG